LGSSGGGDAYESAQRFAVGCDQHSHVSDFCWVQPAVFAQKPLMAKAISSAFYTWRIVPEQPL
jgi:hypothetical protein